MGEDSKKDKIYEENIKTISTEAFTTLSIKRYEDLIGRKIVEKYEVLEFIAEGGSGLIYKVKDINLSRKLGEDSYKAIKIIGLNKKGEKGKIISINEVRKALNLTHQNIVKIFDIEEINNLHIVIMEYLEGKTLQKEIDSRIRNNKDFKEEEIVSILSQIANGLKAIHEKGIIHRDLKPANIFMTKNGEIKILDFGIAFSTSPKSTQSIEINSKLSHYGTLLFMSPENINLLSGKDAEIDERVDIWSFGIIGYKLITGKLPFAEQTEILYKGFIEPKTINKTISEDLNDLICNCLKKNKEERYQSVDKIIGELKKIKEKDTGNDANLKDISEEKKRIREKEEVDFWQKAREKSTGEAYKEYIEKHPDDSISDAKRKIKEIEEDEEKAWERALKLNTISAFDKYLRNYPSGKHSREAESKCNISIFEASKKGYLGIVKYLISNGVDVNAKDDEGSTPLHSAAVGGHLEVVKYLISKGADVNARNNTNQTPLWYACHEGHLDIVKYLISKGAIWNEAVKDYGFPVSQAAAKGHLDVVKYFIEELHFDVNKKDREGWTLLHCGARYGHLEVVKYTIFKGLDVNSRDKHNETPLWKACIGGYLNIVKYLISKGAICDEAVKGYGFPVSQAASKGHLDVLKYFIEELHFDVNKKDKDGWTLLHWGARFNQPDVVKYLISVGADVSIKNNNRKTPLDLAKSEGNVGCVFFLSKGDLTQKEKNEPLLKASEKGNLEGVKLLVENGADLNARDDDGNTPLHKAVLIGNLEVVKYLVENGADLNARDDDGNTPLHLAVLIGNLEVVKYLISKGADVNAKDNKGWTPLHKAVLIGNLEVVKYLVSSGADVNAKSTAVFFPGFTPLHLAAENGHLEVVKYLISKGADVNARDNKGRTPSELAAESGYKKCALFLTKGKLTQGVKNGFLLKAAKDGNLEDVKHWIEKGADVNAKTNSGYTSLHEAAKKGNLEVVKYLVENGADVNIKDDNGRTPSEIAAEYGNKECALFLGKGNLSQKEKNNLLIVASNLEDVKYWIEKGADVNVRGYWGETPLHMAAIRGHLETVKYLISKGADINVKDDDGSTPLHLAAENGHLEVVKYLISKGADVREIDIEDANTDEIREYLKRHRK